MKTAGEDEQHLQNALSRECGLGARWLSIAVATLAVLVALTVAFSAAAAQEHRFVGSFGPDGTAATEFAKAGAIVIDQQSGDVYVADPAAGAVYKFDQFGNPVAFTGSAAYLDGNAITGLDENTALAIDQSTHVLYVATRTAPPAFQQLLAFQQNGEPAPFSAGPGAGTNEISGFAQVEGVATDTEGNIYVSDRGRAGAGAVHVYRQDGEALTEFRSTQPSSIAVGPSGTVYVAENELVHLTAFSPDSLPVTSATTFTPGTEPFQTTNVEALAVDPATGNVFAIDSDRSFSEPIRVSEYDTAGNLISRFAGPGEEGELEHSQGVGVNGGTGAVYASYFGEFGSKVEIFSPPVIVVGPPSASELTIEGVSADSATLLGSVNPNSFETRYHFELGTEDCERMPDPCTQIAPVKVLPAGRESTVSDHLSGLAAGTTYHFRLLVESSAGQTASEDATFTTQNTGGSQQLPDGRQWELVSPAVKQGGGIITRPEAGLMQASADGGAFTFLTLSAIQGEPAGNRAPEPSQSLAQHGESGWQSAEISPPHAFASEIDNGTEFREFSTNLERAAVEPQGSGLLSEEASERTPYLREGSIGSVRWRPLATTKEPFADVPPGTVFGGKRKVDTISPVRFRGASPDLRHIVISSEVPLSPEAEGVPVGEVSERGLAGLLYEWFEGKLRFVSALPSGEAAAGALGSATGEGSGSIDHAVSEDGRFVYWNVEKSGETPSALYLRDLQNMETVRLDVPQSGASGAGEEHPLFQGASADGRRVFFTDPEQLTADASPSGADLYECEVVEAGGGTDCHLRDITPTSESAGFQGVASAIDENGEAVFFVANGVLAAGAEPGHCRASPETTPARATCSLYVSRFTGGAWSTRFVATLPNRDAANWGLIGVNRQDQASTAHLVNAISPNGRYFTFMTSRPLTGYDNRAASSGVPAVEVYLYDTEAEGAALKCISCNPTNARPRAALLSAVETTSFIDWDRIWKERWVAATLPESNTPEVVVPNMYRPRSVLNDGRVFFNSIDPLVPADASGAADAYEYEPTGVGGCVTNPTGARIAPIEGGCVSLLSAGTSGRESAVLDASENGDDLFFLTAAPLTGQDTDTAYDIYDAHVCGSGWPCASPTVPVSATPCASTGGCRSIQGVSPETGGSPGSATYSGPENVKPKHHHKAKHKKHKKKHRKKNSKTHKRGAQHRSAPGRIGGVK